MLRGKRQGGVEYINMNQLPGEKTPNTRLNRQQQVKLLPWLLKCFWQRRNTAGLVQGAQPGIAVSETSGGRYASV